MTKTMWACAAVCAAGLLIVAFAPVADPGVAPRGAVAAIVPVGYFLALIGGAAAVVVWMRGRSR